MNEGKPLEKRVRLTDAERSVARRIHASGNLLAGLARKVLDASPMPTLIYFPDGFVLPNVAAIKEFDSTFEHLSRHTDAELVVGKKTRKVRAVLKDCETVGWNELDFAWSIKEKSGNELLFEPHVSLTYENGLPFWYAYVPEVKNIDLKTARGKMRAMGRALWQRCQQAFQRDLTYVNAQEHTTRDGLYDAVKASVIKSTSLVIDLKSTKTLDAGALQLILMFGQDHKDRLFLMNVQDDTYRQLRGYHIPDNHIYRSRKSEKSQGLASFFGFQPSFGLR